MSSHAKNTIKPFVYTRTFNAPRELVFEAWTNPEHTKHWLAPAGFVVAYKTCDIKPGGISHYSMTGPGGMKMWGKAIYKEITKPKFVSYFQYFSDEEGGVTGHPMSPTWPKEMFTTVTLEDKGQQTFLTLTWAPTNSSAEEIKTFDDSRDGMTQGWNGSFDSLDAYLQSLAR